MAKTKQQKQEMVAMYKQLIEASSAVLFVRPQGVTANESVELKQSLSDLGSKYNVIKNNLFKIALRELDMPEVAELESGANAVVFCGEDFAAAAKSSLSFPSS